MEEYARKLFRSGLSRRRITTRLSPYLGGNEAALAVLSEVENTGNIGDGPVRRAATYPKSGLTAGTSGLGCRGAGDHEIHRLITRLASRAGAVVGAPDMDDGGVVSIPQSAIRNPKSAIAVAVDGLHSRLSEFPFLAGFHAARAALRDVLVMGAAPVCLISDVHIANDGDVGKVFDCVAGVAAAGEAIGVPLVSGSTLRIGGDMVLGDRLTGSAGAVGTCRSRSLLTSRSRARPGDVLLLTEGSGGGTITTTALYNGLPSAARATLTVRSLLGALSLVKSADLGRVHAMTDVTNGGIRLDAWEVAASSGAAVEVEEKAFLDMVEPRVLSMLKHLSIDPLGVSVDSLLLTLGRKDVGRVAAHFERHGVRTAIAGRVVRGRGARLVTAGGETIPLEPLFREAPYTPLKRVVAAGSSTPRGLVRRLRRAAAASERKKKWIVRLLNHKQ